MVNEHEMKIINDAFDGDRAISLKAALEAFADYVASGYADSAEDFEEYSRILCELPSVKPQEKTAHWIQTNEFFINQDGQFIYKFICSECKSLSYFRKSDKKAIGANVCPNCGRRMVEPQEGAR